MLEVNETDLVFAFPDVDEEAILRVHCCPTDSPGQRIGIGGNTGSSLRLAADGPFVMSLQPNHARRDCMYRSLRTLRYPFALLVSVGGKNAITGVPSVTLDRSPQNYFTSPPQGGIDGYFREARVHAFRAVSDAAVNQTRLEISVFPMKSKAMANFRYQTGLIPGPDPSALRGITLLHGGERQCEPIYEDICNIGSWDKDHEERASLWVGRGS
jgi:hypothetical protein